MALPNYPNLGPWLCGPSASQFSGGRLQNSVDGRQRLRFMPYEHNGGNVVAIAGEDFSIISSDTRLSVGFHIHSRDQKKLFRLSEQSVLGSCGCWCDVLAFTTIMDAKMKMYEHEHRKTMNTNAAAQLISSTLYQRRLFPFLISNILAGLDAEGKGCVFSFDPIGHAEQNTFCAAGKTAALIQPLLDNQVGRHNVENLPFIPVTQERAMSIIRDVFVSAAERDMYTGDGIICYTITKKAITVQEFPLRKD